MTFRTASLCLIAAVMMTVTTEVRILVVKAMHLDQVAGTVLIVHLTRTCNSLSQAQIVFSQWVRLPMMMGLTVKVSDQQSQMFG